MKTYTVADTVDNKDDNALRYAMEMQNTLSRGSALPGHILSFKKGYIVVLLLHFDPKNWPLNRTTFVGKILQKSFCSLESPVEWPKAPNGVYCD